MVSLKQSVVRKACAFLLLCGGIVTPSFAVDSSYYSSLDGKSGATLYSAVGTVANMGYTGTVTYKGIWTAYQSTDINSSGNIWDVYSDCDFTYSSDQCGTYSNVCDCYNREHSLPQDWFDSDVSTSSKGVAGTDMFHIYPTDGKTNGMRSSYPYGECSDGTIYGTGKLGTSTFTEVSYSGKVFEPADEYKGDLARGYFYMITFWGKYKGTAFNVNLGSVTFNTTYTSAGGYGLTAYGIALLMKWHREDPVSQKEIDRNNALDALAGQGNRNPFIDYPCLAEYFWGTKKDETFNLSDVVGSFESSFVPGTSDGCACTPATEYTVTLSKNGTTSLYTGSTLPTSGEHTNSIDCSGTTWTFAGWSSTSVSSTTSTPTYVTAPTANGQTFYAVYTCTSISASSTNYSKISSLTELTNGSKCILLNSQGQAINTSCGSTAQTVSDNISSPSSSLIWNVARSGDNFTFTSGSTTLGVSAQSKGTVISNNSTYGTWTIVEDKGGTTGAFNLVNSIELQYYSSTFKLYAWSSSYKQYFVFYIYIPKTVSYASEPCSATSYTITWLNDGATYATNAATENAKPTLPSSVPTCSDDVVEFVGWTAQSSITSGAKPSDLFATAADAPTITGNTTFRAVFAKVLGSATEDNYVAYSGALTAGDYIIVDDRFAMSDSLQTTSSTSRLFYKTVENEYGVISAPSDSIVWTISANSTYWELTNKKEGKYLRGGNSAMSFNTSSSDYTKWTVTESSGVYNFVNKYHSTYYLRRNGTYGFALYATQGDLKLYKKATTSGKIVSDYSLSCFTVPVYFTVTFNKKGYGSPTPADQTILKGSTATEPTTMTTTNFTFAGWYTDYDCTQAYSFSTPVTGNLTLYAKWEGNPYTVIFKNGSTTVSSQTVRYLESPYLPGTLGITGVSIDESTEFLTWDTKFSAIKGNVITNAQITSFTTYYANAAGKNKSTLKSALNGIISGGRRLDYSGGPGQTWEIFYYSDNAHDGTNKILDMYSNESAYFPMSGGYPTYASVSGMAIEHSFAKSWWGSTVNYAYKDCHHLNPANSSANGAKSNYVLGEVETVTKVVGTGTLGTATYGGSTITVWEPADEYKGDFARAYFYMATLYGDSLTWEGEGLNMLQNTDYKEFKDWAITLLLKWHREDPVSSKEIARNNFVCQYQQNRNPYIDYPCLVEYIWGDKQEETVDLSTLATACVSTSNATFYNVGVVYNVQTLEQGQHIVKPEDPTNCDDYEFVGWSLTQQSIESTTLPSIVTEWPQIIGNQNVNYYAVYSHTAGGLSNNYEKISSTDDLTTGNYVIAGYHSGTYYALKDEVTSNYYMDKSIVTVSDNIISNPIDSVIWYLTVSGTNVTIYSENAGNYLYAYTTTNKDKTKTYYDLGLRGTSDDFTFSFSLDSLILSSVTYPKEQIEYYSSRGYFSLYTAQDKDAPIYIYKQKSTLGTYYTTSPIGCTATSSYIDIIEWADDYLLLDILDNEVSTISIKQKSGNTYTTIANDIDVSSSKQLDGTIKVDVSSKGVDFNDYSCSFIKLETFDALNTPLTKTIVKVPIIIDVNSNTDGDKFIAFSADVCKECDVVVRDEAILTNTTSTNIRPHIRDLSVYAGSTLNIESGTYIVNSLTLQSRGDTVAKANLVGSLISNKDSVYFSKRISSNRYYFFGVPYVCKLSQIYFTADMQSGIRGTDWQIKEYDAASRAIEGSSSGTPGHWKIVEDASLMPGKGYILGVSTESAGYTREMVFPMRFAHEDNKLNIHETVDYTTSIALNTGSTTMNNWNWNFVSNPFFTTYNPNLGATITAGYLSYDSKADSWSKVDDSHIYVTIPQIGLDNTITKYNQVLASSYTIDPFTAYFVQGKSAGTLTFANANSPASLPARRTAADVQDDYTTVEVDLTDGIHTDPTIVLIDNQFTADYELGYDLGKALVFYSEEPQIYMRDANKTNFAFLAVNDSLAAASMPMGFYAYNAGAYTFTLNRSHDLSDVEAVYLIDSKGETVNLMQQDYEISITKSTYTNTRFSLIVTKKRPEVTTSFDNLESTNWSVWQDAPLQIKTLSSEEGEIRLYDAAGRLLQTAEVGTENISLQVPSVGVYCVERIGDSGTQVKKILVR